MRARNLSYVGLIGVAVIALMPALAASQDVPTLAGKSPIEWAAVLKSPHPAARDDALLAFEILGTAAKSAVPSLIDALDDPSGDVRLAVYQAFLKIGGAGAAAVPALIRKGGTPEFTRGIHNLAIHAVTAMGPAAVPALITFVEGNNQNDRRTAVQALGRLGPAAKDAAPALTKLLHSQDPVDVRLAVPALADIGADARIAIPALFAIWEARALQPRDLQDDVFEALIKIGASPSPRMIAALDNPDPDQRAHAIKVLSAFGPRANATAGKLETLLDDPSPMVREQAAMALWKVDPANRRVLAALTVAFVSEHLEVMSAAISEVAKLGPKAAPLAPELKKLIARIQHDIDLASAPDRFETVAAAAAALVAVSPNSDEGVAALIALSKDGWQGQDAAATVLRRLGPKASAAAPALVAVTQNGNTEMRLIAALALVRVDPANPALLPSLIALASYEPPPVDPDKEPEDVPGSLKLYATVAIGQMNERALPAVPTLVRMLEAKRDDDSEWQPDEWEAIPLALARIGPAARAAIPALVRVMRAPRGSTAAGRALRAIGPAASSAIPELIELLKSEPRVRASATEVLGALGPAARAAVPALVGQVSGPDATAALEAALALLEIDPGQRELVEAQLRTRSPIARLRSRALLDGALARPTPEADGLTRVYLRRLDRGLKYLGDTTADDQLSLQVRIIAGIENSLETLSHVAKGSDAAIRRLTDVTQHSDPYIARLAADTLIRIKTRLP